MKTEGCLFLLVLLFQALSLSQLLKALVPLSIFVVIQDTVENLIASCTRSRGSTKSWKLYTDRATFRELFLQCSRSEKRVCTRLPRCTVCRSNFPSSTLHSTSLLWYLWQTSRVWGHNSHLSKVDTDFHQIDPYRCDCTQESCHSFATSISNNHLQRTHLQTQYLMTHLSSP